MLFVLYVLVRFFFTIWKLKNVDEALYPWLIIFVAKPYAHDL